MPEQVPAPLAAALGRRYTIQQELGRGGTAFVFLAHDLKHDRPVAIKVLRPEIAVLLGVERFLREIRFAAQLQHPHIVPLFDSGEAGGSLYYVMPYVAGQSLRQRLERDGPLPLGDAVGITRDVCDALTYAHGQDIVHRDIKPENILLEVGHALVADFGLARAIAAAGGEKLSETGMTVGTPAYMSPEQAGAESRIDGRSDVYSLGCVLYEMLAGAPPFTGPSAQALLARHALDPVPPLRTVRKAVPEQVEHAVMKALEKVPADRFPSAAAFAAALTAPSAPLTRQPGRSKRLAALIAGIVVLLGAGGWLAARARSASPPRIQRIAVLPLENLTGDTTQSFFVDGMHEALVDELAQIEAVSVISRTSVLRYRGVDRPPLPEIARRLGVDAVVEGTVARSGDSVRVAVQLIDGRTNRHLWAKTYVRDLRDVLRLYGELVTDVAGQIRSAVTPVEQHRLADARQIDPDVYTLSLKGGYQCGLWTEHGLRSGIQLLRQAVERDPTYAPAYARLAGCYSDLSFFGYAPPGDLNPIARAAVTRALELDSTLGEAHATLGWIRFVTDLDFDGPDQDFQRALELSPGSAPILLLYSNYLTLAGRFADGVALNRRAILLDPLSAATSVSLGWTYFKAHRYDESIAQLRRTLELEPGYWAAHFELGWGYQQNGMPDAAVAHCDSAVANAPQADDQVVLGTCGWVYGQAGRRQKAQETLQRLTAISSRRWLDPVQTSYVYMGLGDRDRAVEALRKGAREHSQSLVFLKVDPFFDPLRSDPRFKALLRELGIKS
jgi:eukaryotic-like serine/threonine-protein kinase